LAKTERKREKRLASRVVARVSRAPLRGAGASAQASGGLVLGVVAQADERGIWVELPGQARRAVEARVMTPPGAPAPRPTLRPGQTVVLMIDRSRGAAPILLGVLQPLSPSSPEPERRLELEAQDEIVLRCGEASVVLRRNGRIVVRGVYVETRARGVNRIKGGSVSIN
jgi:hypothetical protein